VLDEAEITLPPFVQDLQSGSARRIYRSSGFCDIRKTPAPAWHLIRMKHYACMNLQFSRGCPYNCEFCNVTVLFGHRMRMKTPQQVIAELDGIYAAGWRSSIFFVDDNFIGNKKYLKEHLLPALIEWRKDKKGCGFFTEASINLADDTELMEMMVQAGFDSVFIGIESPDDNCLNECRKTHNKDRDLVGDVKKLHRNGLQVMGGFIVGFDSDSPSIFQRQIDFIQNSSIVTAMVGMLQAPPGTRLFERLSKENRVSSDFFRGQCGWRNQHYTPDGPGTLDGWIPGHHARNLHTPVVLSQNTKSIEGAQGADGPSNNGFSTFSGFFSFLRKAGHHRQGKVLLLASAVLDVDPKTQNAALRHHSGHLRPSYRTTFRKPVFRSSGPAPHTISIVRLKACSGRAANSLRSNNATLMPFTYLKPH
jgi:uncharacterized radical SAM superfamily protein